MVEEAAGNLPASQTWMRKAQTTLKQAGWKDCSETHLKKLVQALNKQDSCDGSCGKH
jgi:5,10-methylene-tetrahydrofolate dehydrogenase/methenyl tetrahydrofolate cyclohydrolase